MTKSHRKIGDEGEDLAAEYLESKGWIIIDRNYFFEKAEVDIVATDGHFIVFMEVKLRSGTYFGRPEDFITPEKEENIKKAAEAWVYERKMETAVCLQSKRQGAPKHRRNASQPKRASRLKRKTPRAKENERRKQKTRPKRQTKGFHCGQINGQHPSGSRCR